jgi:hypothetical protein
MDRWIDAQAITSCKGDAVLVLKAYAYAYANVLCRMSDSTSGASSEQRAASPKSERGPARCPFARRSSSLPVN